MRVWFFFLFTFRQERLLLCRVFHLLSVALNKYISAGYHYSSRELRCMCVQLFSEYKTEEENSVFECRVKLITQRLTGETSYQYVICFFMSYTVHSTLCAEPRFIFIYHKDIEKALMLGCLSMSSSHQNQPTHAPALTEESLSILNYTFKIVIHNFF